MRSARPEPWGRQASWAPAAVSRGPASGAHRPLRGGGRGGEGRSPQRAAPERQRQPSLARGDQRGVPARHLAGPAIDADPKRCGRQFHVEQAARGGRAARQPRFRFPADETVEAFADRRSRRRACEAAHIHPEGRSQRVEDRHFAPPERGGERVSGGAPAAQQARRGGSAAAGERVSQRDGQRPDGAGGGVEVHQAASVGRGQFAIRQIAVEVEMFGAVVASGHRVGSHIGGRVESRQQFGIAELVAEPVLEDGEAAGDQRRRKRRAARSRAVAPATVHPHGRTVIGDQQVLPRGGDAPFRGDAAAVGERSQRAVAPRRHHRNGVAAHLLDENLQRVGDRGGAGVDHIAPASRHTIGLSVQAFPAVLVPGRPDQQGLVRVVPSRLDGYRDGVVQGGADGGLVVVFQQADEGEAHIQDIDAVDVGQRVVQPLPQVGIGYGEIGNGHRGVEEGVAAPRLERDGEHLQVGAPGDAVKVLRRHGRRRAAVAPGADKAGDRRAVAGTSSRRIAVSGDNRHRPDPATVELPMLAVDAGVDEPHRHAAPGGDDGAFALGDARISLRRSDRAQAPVQASAGLGRGAVFPVGREVSRRKQGRRRGRRRRHPDDLFRRGGGGSLRDGIRLRRFGAASAASAASGQRQQGREAENRRRAPETSYASKHQSNNPFCACRRFSAWSHTAERGPSITASVTSSPRCAGRQCRNSASGAALSISASSTR